MHDLWQSLNQYRDENVFTPLEDDADAPEWWRICLELLMIADEACKNIGFLPGNVFFDFILNEYTAQDVLAVGEFRRIQESPYSLSTAAEDLLCVQAKARTASVGCTLRSLTHNLPLLPPRGQVRARWVAPLVTQEASGDGGLGLLLVPFPYLIRDSAVRPAGVGPSYHWGWFDVRQTWLPRAGETSKVIALVDYVVDLVASARSSGTRVDAVILPELALDYYLFRRVARALAQDAGIDFFVSGLSKDARGRPGNFVAIAPFFVFGHARDANITGWQGTVLIREKHHR